MPRYRNVGSLPLNYGDGCPRVEPMDTFVTEDYPRMPLGLVEQHITLGLIEEVRPPAAAPAVDLPEDVG